MARTLTLWALLTSSAFAGELDCLADLVYREARGEPALGQLAVAKVAKNRKTKTGETYCHMLKSGQFAPHKVKFGADYPEVRSKAVQVEQHNALSSFPATHFHEKSRRPYWAKKVPKVAMIGRHVFYQAY